MRRTRPIRSIFDPGRRVRRLALALAFAASGIAASSSVVEAGCYSSNNGVAVALVGKTAAKGVQATQDLSAATPHSSATGIVHPVQVGMASGDFVGWGTTIGVGTNDPFAISNCDDNLGTRWAIYVDGTVFGQYFCRQAYGSEPATITNQHAEIIHTSCAGSTQWTFKWNSTVKTCQTVNGVSGLPSVGSESIGFDTQNLDLHEDGLTYRVLGGSWTSWYSAGEATCQDFVGGGGYDYVKHSATDFSFFDF